jgi:hypothetical protein
MPEVIPIGITTCGLHRGINRAMVGATNTARDYYGDTEYDAA